MFSFRPTYEPLIKFCKELIAEKKELQEELESTKHELFYTKANNRFLSESLEDLQNEKRKDLEKRVADLEDQLAKKVLLLDDEGTPIKSFTLTGKLTILKEPTEEKLEVGKWYDARTFEEEKLKKLLPVGTLVAIVTDGELDERRNKPEGDRSIIVHSTVTSVDSEVSGWNSTETVIYVERYQFVSNNWFKIIEEY
nr:MAG TPA: hypothetical protein [Caudoviricetes sp.]